MFGGRIGSEKLCEDAFDDIIGQCFTKNDGEDLNYDGRVSEIVFVFVRRNAGLLRIWGLGGI